MRILVTGKNGQLGQSINKLINIETKIENNPSSNEFIFVGREELDLSNNSSIINYFDNHDKFDIVINSAAYTAVDQAELSTTLIIMISLILSLTLQLTLQSIKQKKSKSLLTKLTI